MKILYSLMLVALGYMIGIMSGCYEAPIIKIAQQKVMVICADRKDKNWVELECRCQDIPVLFKDILELPAGCSNE